MFGGWEDIRTLLIPALSSSTSCWLSLVQAASMALMYSKLGGCLGVTTKLGPLARTDLWAGVKGLLERLMTHWGLGSSLEEPWGGLLGGDGGVVFPGDGAILLGRLGCPVPGGTPMALPNWPSWIAKLTCLGRDSGLGNAASFTGGRRAVAWEELLPSPGGRWAIARVELGGMPDAWLLAGVELMAWEGLPPSPAGRWAAARRELLPSPGGRWAIARVELGGMPDAWLLTGVELMTWEGLLTSLEESRVPAWLLVWGVLLPSPGGKH